MICTFAIDKGRVLPGVYALQDGSDLLHRRGRPGLALAGAVTAQMINSYEAFAGDDMEVINANHAFIEHEVGEMLPGGFLLKADTNVFYLH
ncbi:hypothetical protein PmP19_34 [Proteus phage PmP19]|uniref:Uncharacterized protein n=1 Tax=Proteus phage PmP19 TaxID=2759188 RepID=A0A7S9XGW7_9CAUD|nr:hypothetical protein PmP19_34 [Proteus phage PmP19]